VFIHYADCESNCIHHWLIQPLTLQFIHIITEPANVRNICRQMKSYIIMMT